MKWEIRKEWIEKEYYEGRNETFSCLYYLREWNGRLYAKEIKICSNSSAPKNTRKMLEAAFNKENNKPVFMGMSLYSVLPATHQINDTESMESIFNSMPYKISVPNTFNSLKRRKPWKTSVKQTVGKLYLSRYLKCSSCGKKLTPQDVNYFDTHDPAVLFCHECDKLNHQINKLKE